MDIYPFITYIKKHQQYPQGDYLRGTKQLSLWNKKNLEIFFKLEPRIDNFSTY